MSECHDIYDDTEAATGPWRVQIDLEQADGTIWATASLDECGFRAEGLGRAPAASRGGDMARRIAAGDALGQLASALRGRGDESHRAAEPGVPVQAASLAC